MTTFLLIRHASHDLLGRVLTGRAPGVHLNAAGKIEAERLAERLARVPLRAIYSSPLERACETAWPIAASFDLEMQVDMALNEINCGDWTGGTFSELSADPAWQQWNAQRSAGRAPRGETMAEVAERVARRMDELETTHPSEHVALVSHGDVIRAVLLHFLGMSFDAFGRLEISPGSVTIVTLRGGDVQVRLLNDTGELATPGARNGRRRVAA